MAKYTDWQALVRIATITGDGTATEFPLPEDYDRMLLDGSVYSGAWAWGYSQIGDVNRFLRAEEWNFPLPGGWVLYADALHFNPAPASAAIAKFPYITKNWARDFSTAPKAEFTKDDDSFLLPERLLTLGLVWRWRENKKLDATGDQEAFIKALDEYAGKQNGPVVIRHRAARNFGNTHLAYPWELGPADYWPAA